MITETDVKFLRELRKLGQERPGKISEATHMHRVVMHRKLNKLMQEGYIEKHTGFTNYNITPKGKKLLDVLEVE